MCKLLLSLCRQLRHIDCLQFAQIAKAVRTRDACWTKFSAHFLKVQGLYTLVALIKNVNDDITYIGQLGNNQRFARPFLLCRQLLEFLKMKNWKATLVFSLLHALELRTFSVCTTCQGLAAFNHIKRVLWPGLWKGLVLFRTALTTAIALAVSLGKDAEEDLPQKAQKAQLCLWKEYFGPVCAGVHRQSTQLRY